MMNCVIATLKFRQKLSWLNILIKCLLDGYSDIKGKNKDLNIFCELLREKISAGNQLFQRIEQKLRWIPADLLKCFERLTMLGNGRADLAFFFYRGSLKFLTESKNWNDF